MAHRISGHTRPYKFKTTLTPLRESVVGSTCPQRPTEHYQKRRIKKKKKNQIVANKSKRKMRANLQLEKCHCTRRFTATGVIAEHARQFFVGRL
jgi:hypothetical protein